MPSRAVQLQPSLMPCPASSGSEKNSSLLAVLKLSLNENSRDRALNCLELNEGFADRRDGGFKNRHTTAQSSTFEDGCLLRQELTACCTTSFATSDRFVAEEMILITSLFDKTSHTYKKILLSWRYLWLKLRWLFKTARMHYINLQDIFGLNAWYHLIKFGQRIWLTVELQPGICFLKKLQILKLLSIKCYWNMFRVRNSDFKLEISIEVRTNGNFGDD